MTTPCCILTSVTHASCPKLKTTKVITKTRQHAFDPLPTPELLKRPTPLNGAVSVTSSEGLGLGAVVSDLRVEEGQAESDLPVPKHQSTQVKQASPDL